MKRRELDLIEFFYLELRKWKVLFIAAIVGAILLGGGGYLNTKKNNNDIHKVQKDNIEVDSQINDLLLNMSDESINKANSYYEREVNYRKQEEYYNNSLLMKFDANNLREAVYIISVDYKESVNNNENIDDLAGYISSLYKESEFLEILREDFYSDMNVSSYISEIISIQNINNPMKETDAASSFQLVIYIPNDSNLEEYNKCVEDYTKMLNSENNNYVIKVVNEGEIYNSDYNLLSRQREVIYAIDNYKAKMDSDKATLNENEKKLVELMIEKEYGVDKKEDNIEASIPQIKIRNIIIGMIMGIIIVVGFDFCRLLVTDKVTSMDEIRLLYSINPLMVFYDKNKKRYLNDDKKIYNIQYKKYFNHEKQFDNFKNIVKMLSQKDNIEVIDLLVLAETDTSDDIYIKEVSNLIKDQKIGINIKKIEFIGDIDISNQVCGNSPVIIYLRQETTYLSFVKKVINTIDKSNLLGMIYVDC